MLPRKPLHLLLAPVLWLLAGTLPQTVGATTLEYTVLTMGERSGREVLTQSQDRWTSEYFFNDRGRGPELDSGWRLDRSGQVEDFRTSGKSYMKTPVDETFQRQGHRATWAIGGKRESAESPEGFYLPLNAPPSYQAVLAAALLRAPGNTLALLPNGRASARELARETLDQAPGRGATVRAIEISGLDYEPQIIWLDEADHLYFLDVGGWFTAMQTQAAAHAPRLLEVQRALRDQRLQRLARELRDVPATPVLISNARLFDPRTLRVTPATSVLVVGKRIAAVGPDGTLGAADNSRRIDAGGRFLMPGLWDNHVHLYGAHPILDLASGITTVRDLANDERTLPGMERHIATGEQLGPRILKAGFIDAEGPFAGPTRARVKDLADAERWINWYADNDYVQIKVYSSLDPKMVAPLARLAHARGLRFSGHVPAHMTAQQFIEAGADEIQHLNFVFLNFLFEQAPDTRDTTRFTAVGRHATEIDPADPRVAAFIRLMADRRVVLDPTINVFEVLYEGAEDEVNPGYSKVVPRLPPVVAREMVGGRVAGSPEDQARYAVAMPALRRMLKALHDAGVVLVPGSDSVPGFGLLRELEVWSEAGISNAEILRAATLTSAQVNRRAADLGVVAPGQLADFILVDGDPLRDISDLRRVRTVVKDGVLHDTSRLFEAVGVSPSP